MLLRTWPVPRRSRVLRRARRRASSTLYRAPYLWHYYKRHHATLLRLDIVKGCRQPHSARAFGWLPRIGPGVTPRRRRVRS
jgi:hypothetical protein